MVVDSKQLISDIVLDTDNKMHKQCKFCGKLLHINDYTALYVNIVYKDIATAYERCTCNEASKIWQQYDEYIEKDKIRKINLSKIKKLFKNNNLGKRQLNSTFENYKITNKNKNAYENAKKYVDKLIKENNELSKGNSLIDKKIKEDGSVRFYLASDSPSEKEFLVKKYGKYIITSSGPISRSCLSGIIEGVVELYTLSYTKKIYGSYNSSYSELASRLNSSKLEILSI